MPHPPVEPEETWQELQPLLDQELNRLPDKYRLPVVLCDLEGRTRKEVARQLQIPDGTLSNRLATARKLLAKRLARHGVTLSGGAIVTMLSPNAASACVPASLVGSTVKAASAIAAGKAVGTATASAKVAGLTEGVLKAMFLTKLKTVTAVVLLLGIVALAGVSLTQRPAAGQPGHVEKKEQTGTGNQGEAEEGSMAPVFFALKKLDVENRTLAVSLLGTNQAVENLPIAKDATILWNPSPRSFSRGGPVWSIPQQEVRLADLEPRLGRIDTPLTLDFAPDGKTVTGITAYFGLSPVFLTGLDAQAMMIEVSPVGGPLGVAFPPTEKLPLPDDVEIIIDGKKGKMTDLRPGMIVEVYTDADHVNAQANVPLTTTPRLSTSLKKYGPFAKIEAYRPLIEAIVEGVEPEKKTLTVNLDHTKLVLENLAVAEDVEVFIDGRQCKLADLKKGTHVVMELRGEAPTPRERRVVTIENSTNAKQGAIGKNDGAEGPANKSEGSKDGENPKNTQGDKKPVQKVTAEQNSKRIDPATVAAYKQIGATIGTISEEEGHLWFYPGEQAAVEGLPGFRFRGKFLKTELPAVSVPFGLEFHSGAITDAGMKALKDLKNLSVLSIRYPYRADNRSQVTDKGLKELASLNKLTMLDIAGTNVTDDGLRELTDLNQLTMLDLSGTKVTGAGLKELDGLKNLSRLHLTAARVTDDGLKGLAGLKNLAVLDLQGTKVTDLKELAALKNLFELAVGDTQVTDAGLKELAGLNRLARLSLNGTKVTDAGLKELVSVKNLTVLHLDETTVTNAGLKDLAGLKNLAELSLRETQVTDVGLKELAGLKDLTALDLDHTQVTDAGLKELAGLKKLVSLNLSRTRVTDAGVAELRKALPECQIQR